MEYRQLGRSGLRVSTLTLGTMTFGGKGSFAQVGATQVDDATRQLDRCLDAGVNLIDTADVYSDGLSEEIVGQTIKGRRDRLLLATKARFSMGEGANDAGPLAAPPDPRLRGQPPQARHGPRRPLPGARA
jgi:aryl-alcohol dehydrogenase-like predicted oxidoreductase